MSGKVPSSVVYKRRNDNENEVHKIIQKPTTSIPNEYGDRFIPRRYAFQNINFNLNMITKEKARDVVEKRNAPGYWRPHNFKIVLNDSLKIEKRKLYQLSDPVVRSPCLAGLNLVPSQVTLKKASRNPEGHDWPCKPRARPYAFIDSTHDLPGFSANAENNVIDWSARGQITASFGKDLVMWTPNTSKTVVYQIKDTKAIAYNPKGDVLATGCERYGFPIVEFWDVSECNVLRNTGRFIFVPSNRDIRCIEWHPSGDSLFCGTSTGHIYVCCSTTFKRIEELQESAAGIHDLKFSPKREYLAASDVSGGIFVWCWNSHDLHVDYVLSKWNKAILAWHPWNGEDLIIAQQMPAAVTILHVPSKEVVGFYEREDNICSINALSFNRLSAELLVSYSIRDADGCFSSEILVMASLDRIVDVLRVKDDCVKFLLWSPNSMELATVASDDTLTIWNFLPNRQQKITKNNNKLNIAQKKRSSLELYTCIR